MPKVVGGWEQGSTGRRTSSSGRENMEPIKEGLVDNGPARASPSRKGQEMFLPPCSKYISPAFSIHRQPNPSLDHTSPRMPRKDAQEIPCLRTDGITSQLMSYIFLLLCFNGVIVKKIGKQEKLVCTCSGLLKWGPTKLVLLEGVCMEGVSSPYW